MIGEGTVVSRRGRVGPRRLSRSLMVAVVLIALSAGVSVWQGIVRTQPSAIEYGYRLDIPSRLGLWWCEGTYKVTRERPLPQETRSMVSISAARNEYEPFQLVLVPETGIETVSILIARAAAHERQQAGDEVWWYICSSPHAPYVTLFIDHSAIDMRIWSWVSWKYNVEGLLIWETTWWTCPTAFQNEPQNPWVDPMSYAVGSTGPEPGKAQYWGNGDGRLIYPPNHDIGNDRTPYLEGPVNSIRWEMLREGIENYEYLRLLRDSLERLKPLGVGGEIYEEAEKLLDIPDSIVKDTMTFTKDPQLLYRFREQVAALLEGLLN